MMLVDRFEEKNRSTTYSFQAKRKFSFCTEGEKLGKLLLLRKFLKRKGLSFT